MIKNKGNIIFHDYESIVIEEIPDKIKTVDINTLPLNDIIKQVYKERGITHFYEYQAKAINEALKGNNVVVTAPTSSGKTEVYLSIAAQYALNGKRSLILYPTKALSRDQSKRIKDFALYGVSSAIYDGDTKQHERAKIRQNPPKILISNVDMLHHILLNKQKFWDFFKDLKLVVVDELHYYNGVLGSHVGQIFRRLNRIMDARHKELQYIATSATISNAKEFASIIFDKLFKEINCNSSFRKVDYVILEPDESYITACLKLAEAIDKKTLIFANSHAIVEKLAYIGKQKGLNIAPYRAGLSYEKRKAIEDEFRKGNIRILASTSALELGIDIGDVDVVILAGFPGAINNLKQRAGRAGRRGQKAYAIIVAKENPLDQFFVDHPEKLFSYKPESCYANPNNKDIKKLHTIAKAYELMIREEECKEECKELLDEGLLKKYGAFYIPTYEGRMKIRTFSLRGAGDKIAIYHKNKKIGERELSMALKELYEGAIYFLGGKAYISKGIDFENKKAEVSLLESVDYYTTPLSERDIEIKDIYKTKQYEDFIVSYGKVFVSDAVIGYAIKDEFSRPLGKHYFNRPYVYNFNTEAVWIDLGEYFDIDEFPEGLHAFEHVLINMTPIIAGNGPNELGGLSYSNGRIFIYEVYENGVGLSKIIFNRFGDIARMAYNRVASCNCKNGCPKCIFDPHCGNDNKHLSKKAAIEIGKIIVDHL